MIPAAVLVLLFRVYYVPNKTPFPRLYLSSWTPAQQQQRGHRLREIRRFCLCWKAISLARYRLPLNCSVLLEAVRMTSDFRSPLLSCRYVRPGQPPPGFPPRPHAAAATSIGPQAPAALQTQRLVSAQPLPQLQHGECTWRRKEETRSKDGDSIVRDAHVCNSNDYFCPSQRRRKQKGSKLRTSSNYVTRG